MDGLFLKALVFAADKHRNQRRKDADASPYINHPIALANILVNEGGITDINVLCGAILHDTIEDTETTKEELTQHFGEKITSIVLDVTDDKTLPKAERKLKQMEDNAMTFLDNRVEGAQVKIKSKNSTLTSTLDQYAKRNRRW